ncbi:tripartite tricarboxylate transporter substrate binding protein [Bradyrhizobium guangzhouense]|uniref:Tripartite tricarboxylate transporter substrate binding protein n=1 Tax=Bradyrhizobium guangzhouense TaxID=1325095 RepID=A0AAE5X2W6_9BRAD|nr:tripartite tricarboxylate transporter substrate binding protein [Bradyrhizobium guangzhouense]QAU47639.1 tripartite tricarboxylate transporter substrate binding protein [Bradyrhizobium guangzhouense]RXH09835.1 tripartite tricarboxylate transporter substrate binding protein [Bradyrhizobium guangzhouense]
MLGLKMTIGRLMLGAGVLFACGAARAADSYPSKPVHILVPYAAGGAVDVLARTLGQALAKTWGQQPVIDNRPGAGGIVASQALTQAAPDGYTLILVASGHPLNQFIYPSVPYDTFKDFTAITEVASSPLAIVVAKDSPYKTLGDLLAAAKKDPDKLSYGMSGNGTSAHLAGELLKYMSGTRIVAIPYKGGAPALTAVISGEIPLSINPLAEAIGQLDGGPVRALAVTSAERSKALPNVPTVAESGVPGYDVPVWWGVLGPAKMPPEIVTKLEADLKAALQDPNVISTLSKIGATPVGSSPGEFDAYIHAEATKWEPVLKAADIRAQ